MPPNGNHCSSCGKEWIDHDGIAKTCQRLQEAGKRIDKALAALESNKKAKVVRAALLDALGIVRGE